MLNPKAVIQNKSVTVWYTCDLLVSAVLYLFQSLIKLIVNHYDIGMISGFTLFKWKFLRGVVCMLLVVS